LNGVGLSTAGVGAIVMKGGSGGKHDMVSKTNSFIPSFHLTLPLLIPRTFNGILVYFIFDEINV
jgi:hypothetical protein